MRSALRVETLKLRHSLVGIVGSAALVGGILLLVAGMMAAVASGDPQIVAKLGPGAAFDWDGLLNTTAQITGAGGLVGFGVVLSWLFAREFADGTVTGLFALPVGRGTIATAKLIVFLVWAVAVSIALGLVALLLGVALGFGAPDAAVWQGLGRQLTLGILTAVVAVPVAWISTVTRSLLAGVSSVIGLVAIAQVSVVAGAGGWMPLAAPALWALTAGAGATPAQLGLSVLVGVVSAIATVVAWRGIQLDR